ncbi:MAG TPA: hypothetical protein VLA12_15890 [Planctomycetaceae bacterium]|nr:hypothetical protein [Planctomycetaceae bacterium]
MKRQTGVAESEFQYLKRRFLVREDLKKPKFLVHLLIQSINVFLVPFLIGPIWWNLTTFMFLAALLLSEVLEPVF